MVRRALIAMLLCGGCAAHATSAVEVAESEPTPTPVVDTEPLATTPMSAVPTSIEPFEPTPDDDETIVEPVALRPDSVAVVGDSLTVSASDEIELALAAIGLDVVVVDALESRRMTRGGTDLPPGTEAVEQILDGTAGDAVPGMWVIALGTNDVASVGSLDGFRAEMRDLLDLIPPDDPVIWVDLWIRDRSESIQDANRQIRAELRRWRGGSAVVDWYAHGDDDGMIADDGVHLTPAGQLLFASSIADTVGELFGE